MATYTASGMTSGAVKQNHLGVNVKIQTYLQEATISAVGQINMHRLPAGAEVIGGKLLVQGVPGTGLAVKDSHGNVYVSTATPTTQVPTEFNFGGIANRLTSSAYMYIEQNRLIAAQAGADSCTYTLITEYLAEADGD